LSFYKPWSKTLVVKVLEKSFTFPVIKRRLESLWARSGRIQVSDMANNFFLVRFSEDDDYQRALFDGPWKIADYYITVARWTPDFNEEAPIQKIMTWVRLPKLPIQFFNRLAVERIGNHIGRTVRLDLVTSEGARARYARVCVEVDLSRPLLGKYVIEDKVFLVEYESLDNICYSCGLYGHKEEECKPAVSTEDVAPPTTGETLEKNGGSDGNSGSWMTVKRRHRKPTSSAGVTPQSKRIQGSRFDVLGDELDHEEPIATVADKLSTQARGSSPDPSQLAESLKAVLDKALNSTVQISTGAGKAKATKTVQKPLSDVTNVLSRSKGKATKKTTKSIDNPEGLVSVPVIFENPIFQSSGSKQKTNTTTKRRICGGFFLTTVEVITSTVVNIVSVVQPPLLQAKTTTNTSVTNDLYWPSATATNNQHWRL
ncbi:hypothetical protein LINPERPRIM_LOCUS36697, partial [Linum perenne]